MRRKSKNTNILIIVSILGMLILPGILLAQTAGTQGYELLAPLPEFDKVYTPGNFSGFVQKAIYLFIIVAAVLATIRIVIGGFKYMTSESLHLKEEGKENIKGAIVGLIILTASFLILNTINPRILNFQLDIAQINVPVSSTQPTQNQQTGVYRDPNTFEQSTAVNRKEEILGKTLEINPRIDQSGVIAKFKEDCKGQGGEARPDAGGRAYTCYKQK